MDSRCVEWIHDEKKESDERGNDEKRINVHDDWVMWFRRMLSQLLFALLTLLSIFFQQEKDRHRLRIRQARSWFDQGQWSTN